MRFGCSKLAILIRVKLTIKVLTFRALTFAFEGVIIHLNFKISAFFSHSKRQFNPIAAKTTSEVIDEFLACVMLGKNACHGFFLLRKTG